MRKIIIRSRQLFTLACFLLAKIIAPLFRKAQKDVWLISETGVEARDNGFAFFEYLAKIHPEIDARYVIRKNTKYEKKLSGMKTIRYRSFQHYLLFINSKVLISSHIMGYSPDFRIFTKLHKRLKIFSPKGKKIFLQHGIIKDDIPSLKADKIDLDLFICGARKEWEYISKNYGYKNGIVKYTGLARYDSLNDESGIDENIILIMPTWRTYLYDVKNKNEFAKTDYFKAYDALLRNEHLYKYLHRENTKIIFYLHSEMQKYSECFRGYDKKIIVASEKEFEVKDLLRKCKLLITDYSSVFFDVAYQKKPIIYYHFDYEKYRKDHYQEGYFSYQKNGFGDIVATPNKCAERIINHINENYKNDKKYLNRIEQFFNFRKTKCCDRIFKEITKVLDGETL